MFNFVSTENSKIDNSSVVGGVVVHSPNSNNTNNSYNTTGSYNNTTDSYNNIAGSEAVTQELETMICKRYKQS